MAGGKFVPDTETLNFTASIAITKIMQRLLENPDDFVLMEKIATIFRLLSPLSLNYNLWESQNRYFLIGRKRFASKQTISRSGDALAKQWMVRFDQLGGYLGVKFS